MWGLLRRLLFEDVPKENRYPVVIPQVKPVTPWPSMRTTPRPVLNTPRPIMNTPRKVVNVPRTFAVGSSVDDGFDPTAVINTAMVIEDLLSPPSQVVVETPAPQQVNTTCQQDNSSPVVESCPATIETPSYTPDAVSMPDPSPSFDMNN
jgi:hypothetical protein